MCTEKHFNPRKLSLLSERTMYFALPRSYFIHKTHTCWSACLWSHGREVKQSQPPHQPLPHCQPLASAHCETMLIVLLWSLQFTCCSEEGVKLNHLQIRIDLHGSLYYWISVWYRCDSFSTSAPLSLHFSLHFWLHLLDCLEQIFCNSTS